MIKVTDLAYVRFRAPDLDRMEAFLTDFGLVRSARTEHGALHARHRPAASPPRDRARRAGASSASACRRRAPPISTRIARRRGAAPVEAIDEPGGGRRVRLTDPNGIAIEVVHGIARGAAAARAGARGHQHGAARARLGEPAGGASAARRT